jgi:2-octaprenyl-6-methoxyphenol hydroxylase
MEIRSDILIVGGGLTGLAAAVALAGPAASTPAQVIVIDPGEPRDNYAGRATAITASSKRMCETLGAWEAIAAHAQPMTEIIVTDSRLGAERRPTLLHFGEADRHGEPSAYMVENRYLIAAFDAVAQASANIEIHTHRAAEDFSFGPGLARVRAADGTIYIANLVIAADGRDSPARRSAGIKTFGWSYGQSGIVVTVAHDLPHHGQAEEHFLPAGPFAILPLTGNRSSLVWTEAGDAAQRLVALNDEDFLAELKLRFGSHRGALRLDGPRYAFPLALQIAQELSGPRLALAGDAGHVIHPIAGLGFNLGLRDVARLAECVAEAMRLGLDPGAPSVLQAYNRWRRFDTVMTAAAMEGINRLFSNDNAALRALRDLGLRAVDRLAPLKPFFMREAAGEVGQLPKLMRGEPI